ncbi:MAG: SGNH hydrolase domain-containing protein, partial [Pseudomonadota bacterium]
ALIASIIPLMVVALITEPWKTVRSADPHLEKVYAAMEDHSSVFRCDRLSFLTDPTSKSCNLVEAVDPAAAKILLVGNSHANSIKEALIDRARVAGYGLRMLRANEKLGTRGARPKFVLEEVRQHDIDYVISHSRMYVGVERMDFHLNAIQAMLARADELSFKFIFVDPVPERDDHVPKAAYQAISLDQPVRLRSKTITDYEAENGLFLNALDEIDDPNFKRFDLAPLLCSPDCRFADDDGNLLYLDGDHLSLTGAEYIGRVWDRLFAFVADDVNDASTTLRDTKTPSDSRF